MGKKLSSLFVGMMLLVLLAACGGGGSSGSGLGGSSGNPTGTTTAATGWEKTTYGTHIRSVGQVADGSFFVAGDVDNSTNSLGVDGYAMQLNGNGTTAWAENPYGGTGGDHFNAIQSVSGGYVVAGDKEIAGVSKAWVMKLDVAGTNGVVAVTPAWEKTYSGSGIGHFYAIQPTPSDGGYIAVGDITIAGDTNGWIAKLDGNGNLAWQQSYGGTASDHLYAVLQTTDGGYVVAGDRDVTPGSGQGWVMKLDSTGSSITTAGGWDASYADTGNAHFYAVQPGPSGNGYVVAGSSGSIGSERGWFVKLSSSGSRVGSVYFGTSGNDHFYAMTSVTGGYVLAGDKSVNGVSKGWVLKVDSNGNGVSSNEWTYGSTSSDHLYAIQQTQDGGYIAGGSTGNSGWVLKLTKDGAAN